MNKELEKLACTREGRQELGFELLKLTGEMVQLMAPYLWKLAQMDMDRQVKCCHFLTGDTKGKVTEDVLISMSLHASVLQVLGTMGVCGFEDYAGVEPQEAMIQYHNWCVKAVEEAKAQI